MIALGTTSTRIIVLTTLNSSMLNAMQFFPSWEDHMGNPSGDTLGRLSAMYSIGSIVSLPVVPYLSDHFGRRMPIIIGCSIMVAAASIQTAAINLPMFEGARFFMGFGNSLAQSSAPLLLTEICHPQHRARITAVYNCLWNVGALICSWISFGTQYIDNGWSWRIPTLIQALPSVIQLLFIFWIPESPRWLLSKERTEDALQMLGKYHADGNIDDPLVQFEFEEIKETIRLEFRAKKSSSFLDFIRTKGNRYRLLLIISLGLFSQWSGNALFSYYANKVYTAAGVSGSKAGLGLDGGNKVLSLIVSISCALLCDRVGRRPLFLAATGGMLLCLMAATVSGAQYSKTDNRGTGIAVIVFFWFHGVCYAFAWSGLLVAYTVEILPFKLRAKGMMIMNISVNVALVINNYVNPIPMDGVWKGSEWKLYCVYTCWIAIELVFVYVFYVETKYVVPCLLPTVLPGHFTNDAITGAPPSRKSPASSTATTPRSASRTSRTTPSCPTSCTARSARFRSTPSNSARPSRTRCKCAPSIGCCCLLCGAVCSIVLLCNAVGECEEEGEGQSYCVCATRYLCLSFLRSGETSSRIYHVRSNFVSLIICFFLSE
jgi:sugar porter (SP) family MFS transporter